MTAPRRGTCACSPRSAPGSWRRCWCGSSSPPGLFKSGGQALMVGLVLLAAACAGARALVRNDFAVQAALGGGGGGRGARGVRGGRRVEPVREAPHLPVALALNAAVVVALADPVGRFLASSFAVACAVFIAYDEHGSTPVEVVTLVLAAGGGGGVAGAGGVGRRELAGPSARRWAWRWWPASWGPPSWTWRGPCGRRTRRASSPRSASPRSTLLLVARLLRDPRRPPGLGGGRGWPRPGRCCWARWAGGRRASSGRRRWLALGYHRREVVLVGLAIGSFAGFPPAGTTTRWS